MYSIKHRDVVLISLWLRPAVSTSSAVCRGLDAVQLRVLTALGDERLVGADSPHARAVHHGDQIGHTHSAEAVRHQDGDATAGSTRIVLPCPRRLRIALK